MHLQNHGIRHSALIQGHLKQKVVNNNCEHHKTQCVQGYK